MCSSVEDDETETDDEIVNHSHGWTKLDCSHYIHEKCEQSWISSCITKNLPISCPICRNIKEHNYFDTEIIFLGGRIFYKQVNPDECFNCIGPYPNKCGCIDYSHATFIMNGEAYTSIDLSLVKNCCTLNVYHKNNIGMRPGDQFLGCSCKIIDPITKKIIIVK
jgi:hypothetical protein